MTFQIVDPREPLLTVEEAQQRVLAEVTLLPTEEQLFAHAHGRVLREDITAPFDVPERDNSAMDGYAVRAADVPGTLRVIEDLPAGFVATKRVEQGTAIRIMTGALLPEGADAVAQVEITDGGDEVVIVHEALKPGMNVRKRGEDMRTGDVVIHQGCVIRAAELAVLAAVQKTRVLVSKAPRVAIFSTGDELIEIDEPRTPGKVVNSNAYGLMALVRETGAIPQTARIVRDTRDATIAAFANVDADFIVSTGGVSVGAYDFVKEALTALGAESKFWRVAMKPGKPVVLSRLGDKLFFGLPGNPVSSMVSFLLFVAPAIRKAMGQDNVLPPVVYVRTKARLKGAEGRRVYSRVRVVAENGELVAHPMRAQGSGVLTSMLQANGLAYVETGTAAIEAGELAPVVLIGTPMSSRA